MPDRLAGSGKSTYAAAWAAADAQRRDRPVPEPVILQMHQDLLAAPPRLVDGLDAMVQLRHPELANLPLQNPSGVIK